MGAMISRRSYLDRRPLLCGLALALALHAAVVWLLPEGSVRRALTIVAQAVPAPLALVLVAAPIPSPPAPPVAAEQPGPVPQPAPGRRPPAAPPAKGIAQRAEPSPASVRAPPMAEQPESPQQAMAAASPGAPVAPLAARTGRVAVAEAGSESAPPNLAGRGASTSATPGAAQAGRPETVATATPRAGGAPVQPAPIADLCPHTVKALAPPRAVQAGLSGMVLVRATVKGGRVRQVQILKSEPGGVFDGAVRAAMAQYVCRDLGETEVLAEQLFEFKLVE
jgi:outer membrane biosynthesis protein TonB